MDPESGESNKTRKTQTKKAQTKKAKDPIDAEPNKFSIAQGKRVKFLILMGIYALLYIICIALMITATIMDDKGKLWRDIVSVICAGLTIILPISMILLRNFNFVYSLLINFYFTIFYFVESI